MSNSEYGPWISDTIRDIEALTRDREIALRDENDARRHGREQVSKLSDYIAQVRLRTNEQIGQAEREIARIEAGISERRDKYESINKDIERLVGNINGYIKDVQDAVVADVHGDEKPSPIPLTATFPADPDKWRSASGMTGE